MLITKKGRQILNFMTDVTPNELQRLILNEETDEELLFGQFDFDWRALLERNCHLIGRNDLWARARIFLFLFTALPYFFLIFSRIVTAEFKAGSCLTLCKFRAFFCYFYLI